MGTAATRRADIGGVLIFFGGGKMGCSRPLFSTDGKNTKLGRIIFIKETKARTGSFPKPLHRDVHLLSFWIAGYRTRGKSLHGAHTAHKIFSAFWFVTDTP